MTKQRELIDEQPAADTPAKAPSAIDTLRRVLKLLAPHSDRDVRRILAFASEERGIRVCNALPTEPPLNRLDTTGQVPWSEQKSDNLTRARRETEDKP